MKATIVLKAEQAGERELAMDLKLEGAPSVDVRQSERTQRSIVAAERIRQNDAFMQMTATQTNHQRIHL